MTQQSRIRTLDLIRGVAVLGILAINIASFAGPGSGLFTPNLPEPGSAADNWAFAVKLVFFEGKMRALFALLFGASLLLFLERREAAGADGLWLQIRRLLWLALFGLLHFALFWDGDILFLYACVGFGALILRHAPPATLIAVAVTTFTFWQAAGIASWLPSVQRELSILAGEASHAETKIHDEIIAASRAEDQAIAKAALLPFTEGLRHRITSQADHPLMILAYNWGEAFTYMLIGMALLRSGFFAGQWPGAALRKLAIFGAGAGLAVTAIFAAWAHRLGYPELMMQMALAYGLAFPHLVIALGYFALLMLIAPRLLGTALGQRLEAAGKMAFTNYLGCTVLMTAIFSGWGLGLYGRFGAAMQVWFVLLAWALMLGWSKPWLTRFRNGPLEWLWRSLAEWQVKPLRR